MSTTSIASAIRSLKLTVIVSPPFCAGLEGFKSCPLTHAAERERSRLPYTGSARGSLTYYSCKCKIFRQEESISQISNCHNQSSVSFADSDQRECPNPLSQRISADSSPRGRAKSLRRDEGRRTKEPNPLSQRISADSDRRESPKGTLPKGEPSRLRTGRGEGKNKEDRIDNKE
jgi:hypothetical protein